MSSYNHIGCSWCGGPFNGENCPGCSCVGPGNEFVYDPNPYSYNETTDFSYPPPQPQTYSCELCGNDSYYGYDSPPRVPLEKLHKALQAICEKLNQQEQAANVSTYTPEPSRRFNIIYDYDDDDDEDEESTIPLNEITSQIPSLVEDTSDNDSECYLPFCDDSPPLDILEDNSVTFSNPLFDYNDDFTSSDDKSLSDEDIPKDNVKIYSNPLFEFDDEYISSDVNPLFDEVFENIESKDSYVSNLDELALLVTPLSDANEDECFDPGGEIDEIDAFLDIDVSTDIEDDYHDSEGDIIYLTCLLTNDTTHNLPPEVFFDHDPKNLKDEPNNEDLKSMVKVFNPEIHEKIFSPTYVRLPFEDRHYLSFTYVIRIFLPYFTYLVDSSLPLSSGSEDTIFDPSISVFHFSSLEPMASHRSGNFMCFNVYLKILNGSPMEICSSTCFVPNITMIWGESS
ncbi:hypothetical protein Tco_0957584 [Tanacetum coccineum]